MEEIQDRYLPEIPNPRRQEIWDDFNSLNKLVSEIIPICSIWISGSFLSDKSEPSDIDLLYIFKIDDVEECVKNPIHLSILEDIARNHIRVKLDMKVDTRLFIWYPNPTTGLLPQLMEPYAKRGFWDEFWSRRYKTKGESHPEDALVRQGYLEVVLDGFTL